MDDRNLGDILSLAKLIEFLSNPSAVKAQVDELIAATTAADEARAKADASLAELATNQAAHTAALEAERAAHVDKLQRERAEFAMAVNRKTAELEGREKAVATGEASLVVRQKECADLKSDLEGRIRSFNAAVDPRPYPRVAG
ncbi:MAG: hypothetical protein WAK04_12465 [Xanthobacteraceae bacterium]